MLGSTLLQQPLIPHTQQQGGLGYAHKGDRWVAQLSVLAGAKSGDSCGGS